MSRAGANTSVVLVTVDCLRADHAGFLGSQRPTTPFLDSLASESVVVPNAIVAGAPTYYSFPAIMASRYPLALGRDVLGLAPGEASLPSVLANAGYRTAAFNAGNAYLCARFGYEQGFEIFCDFLDAEVVEMGGSQPRGRDSQLAWHTRLNRGLARASRRMRPLSAVYCELYFQYCRWLSSRTKQELDRLRRVPPANVLVDHALTWVRGVAGQPFFLWLHFMDAHHPYYPPEEALAAMGREDIDAARARYLNSFWDRGDVDARRVGRHREDVVALYDAGIRWVDMQLERLTEGLRKIGAWTNTALVVTADHGEEFLEHGGRYHPAVKLTEELIRVPLMMRVPGAQGGRMANAPFSLLHLAPTVLDAVGIEPPEEFQGRSQWGNWQAGIVEDGPVVTEVVEGCTNPFRREDRVGSRLIAVRESQYKLIFHLRDGREELFDLQADPGERAPLPVGSARGARRRLLEVARAHVAESANGARSSARVRARIREVRRELERNREGRCGGSAALQARTGT